MGDAVAIVDIAHGRHRVEDGDAGARDDAFGEGREGGGRAVGDRQSVLGRQSAGCRAKGLFPRGRALGAATLVEVAHDRE